MEQDLFGGMSSSDEETEVNQMEDASVKPEASYNNDSMTGADDVTGNQHFRRGYPCSNEKNFHKLFSMNHFKPTQCPDVKQNSD